MASVFFRVYVSYESTEQQRMVLGSDAWMNKHHVKRHGTSLRGQTRVNQRRLGCMSRGNSLSDELEISSVLGAQAEWMLESSAERSALGASLSGARHSSSRRWIQFSDSKNLTAESHNEQTNHIKTRASSPHPILHKKPVSICTNGVYFCDLDQNLKLRIGFA